MPDGLYERDVLAWSEQQADLLKRLAAGERLNAAVDWTHVIEEVHDVGMSALRACKGAVAASHAASVEASCLAVQPGCKPLATESGQSPG